MKTEIKTTHTPGPWRMVKRANQVGVRHLAVDTGHLNGGCWGMNGSQTLTAEHEANAKLIAAAPELLEACQVLERELSSWDGWQCQVSNTYAKSDGHRITTEKLIQARAAIAKATDGK